MVDCLSRRFLGLFLCRTLGRLGRLGGGGSAGWLVQAVSRSGAASKAASARFMVGLLCWGLG